MKINIIQNCIDVLRGKKKLKLLETYEYRKIQKNYKIVLNKIKEKVKKGEKIRVGFIGFMSANTATSLIDLYKIFDNDDLFEATAVVVPNEHSTKEVLLERLDESTKYLKEKNIKFISGYNKEDGSCLDFKGKFDITFFECVYDHYNVVFNIDNFLDTLSFYICYGQDTADNMPILFNNHTAKAYKIMPISDKTKKMVAPYSPIKAENFFDKYIGNPKLDIFYDKTYKPKDVWKVKDKKMKRIIWSPHHYYSPYPNFLKYSDFFFELVEKYRDSVQFCFKPHPALKHSLEQKIGWSKQEVQDYYDKWNKYSNCFIEQDEWVDLFLTSDAMILDSIAFMVEYGVTGKPLCCLYTEENGKKKVSYSEKGEEVFSQLYSAKNKEEIINFIENVVLMENDYQKEQRQQFYMDNYYTENSGTQNIYNYIKDEIIK